MVVAYSPHRDGSGGTLHLPSPTHIRHTDPSSAIAQLRRSLSRSPSKAPTFRILASKSASPSPNSPLSPSPLSPSHRATPTQPASPLGVPVSASAKKTRNTIRRSSPMRTQAHLLRSPAKRALSESSDNGNATSSSPQESQSKMEGKVDHPQTLKAEQNSQAHHNSSSSNAFLNPTSAFSRRENSEYLNDIAAKSSPLKRSDGSRNFDLAHVGSPSAKRRSLHGASFGPDFDIFDQFAAFESSGGSMNESQGFPESATGSQSPVPRRSSSLRKSTLQQRHDKPVPRSRPEFATFPDCSTPNYSKTRTRMSLDNIPQPSRDSPFSSHGALPSASVHPIRKGLAQANLLPMNQRHPLSRTITQSSSSSSMAEDSPTHAPVKQQNFSRPNVFSKSLPLGSNRPTTTAPPGEESSQESGSFATPENYKLAKPLPAAFMSTGLVSKRNKHIDDSQLNLNESIGHMPDTPCKRPASMAAMSPFAQPKSSLNDHRQSRHTMHSFGTPSTPFNPHASRQSSGFGKGVNIFGSTFNHTRRASFLSDTEDNSQPGNFQTQSSNDFDIPPTPTKQASPVEQTHFGHSHRSNGSFGFRASIRDDPEKSPDANVNSKYNIFIVQERGKDGIEENCVGESPSSQLRFRSVDSIPSFSNRFNDMGQCLSPSRHPRKSLPVPFIRVAKNIKTNPSPLSPASPLLGRSGPKTPRTPSENMVPPDPSGLSISARAESSNQAFNFGSSLNMQPPPATPTANRDSFLHFGGHKASVTPIHQSTAAEIDSSMTSRFDKVELIGAGEFSKVFRVSLKGQSNAQSMLSGDCHSPKSSTSSPVRVWAVKKTRKPYLGPKDRHRKQQEVEILKSLGQSEHTVQLFDSWESDSRLYIQTEFCEEGSLDLFLLRAGRKTRLDDFRIWKILLELSEGLKHIHDSNIIHLDLKPANVLITFEGTLKIGDFGMATTWPAAAGIEGEGDREYIGPEVLMGKYDKPADIFALGLITLEIAGNVMLPENGVTWQRLRAGDMTDVPSLTSTSLTTSVSRDSSGMPLSRESSSENLYGSDPATADTDFSDLDFLVSKGKDCKPPRGHPLRAGELQAPPVFMSDPNHNDALDRLVRWMISPEPGDRPVAAELAQTAGVAWVRGRRRAGATIYEGNWGPADDILQDDAEMVDV